MWDQQGSSCKVTGAVLPLVVLLRCRRSFATLLPQPTE